MIIPYEIAVRYHYIMNNKRSKIFNISLKGEDILSVRAPFYTG